ncbi:MAG: Transcriptional regulator, LysR family [uncultured Paraburkholderia sp.]|nr:MAG: Transcriptional regulator, LysR family [uncultured Paraburkholderia sp.]CAH2940592.1 MAG: Transcriptional regulator, LysR family [uncultured Paraburkholderia sp.]
MLHGWLQPRLDQLKEDVPELCPLLSTDESARYVDEIDVDLTIGARLMQQAGLLEVPLLQDEWVTVCSADLAKKPARVPRAKRHLHTGLICLEESLTSESTAPIFRNQLSAYRMSVICDQRLVLDAVLRGRGIACLSRLVAQGSIEKGALTVSPITRVCRASRGGCRAWRGHRVRPSSSSQFRPQFRGLVCF